MQNDNPTNPQEFFPEESQENEPVNPQNFTPQEIIDEYVETYGGAYYGSIFGGYDPDPTPRLVISLVGKTPIKEGESTVFKVTVENAPSGRSDIEFCLGFDKNSSATYNTDYTLSGGYNNANCDNSQLLGNDSYTQSNCTSSDYHLVHKKIPSTLSTVYYKITATPDTVNDPNESLKIIIYAVHTSGYDKDGTVKISIDDVPPPNPGCDSCGDTCDATPHPIHYSDGKILMSATDLSMSRAGVAWSHQRFYDNMPSEQRDAGTGYRWKSPLLSTIMNAGFGENQSRVIELSNSSVIYFAKQASGYASQFGARQTMWEDTTTEKMAQTNGNVLAFHKTTSGNNLAGTLESLTSPGGGKVTFTYSAPGRIGSARITEGSGSTTAIDEMVYTWNTTTNQISSILLRRSTNNGSTWTNLERVNYTYYAASENFGTLGDLKFVTSQIWSGTVWVDTGTYYYRYYKQGEAKGFVNGLKYELTPEDYANLIAAYPSSSSWTDTIVAGFASKYFEYDSNRRVVLEKVRGGLETYIMAYTEFSADYFNPNAVHARTIETRPNGSKRKVYTNYAGKILLSEEIPPAGSSDQNIIHYTVYDNDFQKIEDYSPSSITSYTEQVSGNTCTLTVNVNLTQGLIKLISYHAATSSMPAGYVNEQKIKQGKNGTPITLEKQEYVVQTQGNQKLVLPAKETRYDNAGNLVIQYAYTFHAGTLQIEQKTTTYPAVPTTQNGTNTVATKIERFDKAGRLVWMKDEMGIIHYNEYNVSGNLVKSIQDVQTTTGGFTTALPSGWVTLASARKHLVTEYEYDTQDRLVKTLGPKFDAVNELNQAILSRPVSWAVYDDANRRTMSADGYTTVNSSGVPSQYYLTNPVSIEKRDAAGRTTESIQASRSSTTGALLATDTFAQSSYTSWTRYFYDSKGELSKTWQYFLIPASGDGVKNTNYLETPVVQAKNSMGEVNRTVAPDGTITRTVYDWRGNAIQTWIGTNDTGATETNPKGSGGANDMQRVSETDYGIGGGCSTCSGAKDKVRASTSYPTATTPRVTEYQYDWRGRQIRTINDTDTSGHSTYSDQTYDNMDRVIKSEVYVHPASGSDRLLSRVEYSYDTRGQVWKTTLSMVDPTTGVIQKTLISQAWFDAVGRVYKTTSPGTTRVNNTVYNSLGAVSQSYISDTAGTTRYSQTDTTFDTAGNVIMVAHGDRLSSTSGTGALSQTGTPKARFRYSMNWCDGAGRSIANADYGYYNGGSIPVRPTTVPTRSATVLVTETKYDTATGQARYFDVANRESRTVVDAMGRTVKTIPIYTGNSAADAEYKTEYDTLGRIVAQVDPLGNRAQTVYGKFGRIDATIDPKNGRSDMTYNLIGEVVTQTDPMGRVTTFQYDNLGRQTKVTFPKPDSVTAAPVKTTMYNVQGLVAKETDPLNHETKFEYDGLGRMVKKIDALNGTTVWVYDDEGKLTSITDPVNNKTSYSYDALSRVTAETNQFGHARTIEYLAGSLVSKKTDRNGRYIAFAYDNFDRQTHEYWYSSTGTLQRTITSAFDAFGRPSSVSDPGGTHAFTYDNYDRTSKTTMTLTGLTPQIILDSTFDLASRQLTSSATIGTMKDYLKTFGFDANSQVTSIVQQQQTGGNSIAPKRVDYVYNAAGQPVTKIAYAATTATSKVFDTSFNYDGIGHLTKLTHKNGTTVYADYTIKWDAASRITNFDFTYLSGGAAKTGTYGYDNTDQLKTATYNGFQSNESYGYDANGNRNTNNFTVGTNNRLTSDGIFNYTYDSEGNRLTKTRISSALVDDYRTEYTWDHRNRLAGVVQKNNSLTKKKELFYEYDYLNRLVRRRLDNTGGGTVGQTDVYVHDGYQIVLQFSAATSETLASTTLARRYLWGGMPDELLTDETVVTSATASNVLWVASDHLGSVRDLLRYNGSTTSVANHLTYNAFGVLVSKTTLTMADNTMFAYTGKWTDTVSELQWNINRWYDAKTGKWISEDPIGFVAGDENLYRYVFNSSIFAFDSSGQFDPVKWANELFRGALSTIQGIVSQWSEHLTSFILSLLPEQLKNWASVAIEYSKYAKGSYTIDRRFKTKKVNLFRVEWNVQGGTGLRISVADNQVEVSGFGFGQLEGKIPTPWLVLVVGRFTINVVGKYTYKYNFYCEKEKSGYSEDAGIRWGLTLGLQVKLGTKLWGLGGAEAVAEVGGGRSGYLIKFVGPKPPAKWGAYARGYVEWGSMVTGFQRREIRLSIGQEIGAE